MNAEIIINPGRKEWEGLCLRPSSNSPTVRERVESIIRLVREGGDKAIEDFEASLGYMTMESRLVSEEEFDSACASVSDEIKTAVAKAAENIRAFHKAQMPSNLDLQTSEGVRCCQRAVPIQKVGLYIPGGTAPLFSTVLMLAIPAKVAGCPQVVLCTPCDKEGKVNPAVLYAARFCGVDKLFKVGGAQAIAAMAYGTESIPKVDKIFGPGNQFVTTAKQMLGGRQVAIDMPAGPSEVMVMADSSANPAFVAADLLSQAEHGRDSQVMLVCMNREIADKVAEEVDRQAAILGRAEFVEESLSHSRFVVFDDADTAIGFANAYAAEHLIISMENPWDIADKITAAGSVFIGNYSPESAGDYASGTNHTLPTCGWARSFSGVNIDAFIRKITFQELTAEGLAGLSQTIITMAEAEGLQAHANAVKVRL